MNIFDTEFPEVKRIELRKFSDSRGFFVERFRLDLFRKNIGAIEFVQDNFSNSKVGVIRGLHFQVNPGQSKLVGVTAGRIFDVVVDVRPESPNYKKWIGVELSAENQNLLWIPTGFAHGFAVLGDEPADVFYKVDQYFSQPSERGIRFDDASIGIQWPKIKHPVISDKDRALPLLSELKDSL